MIIQRKKIEKNYKINNKYIMNFRFFRLLNKVKVPPTRGIRYRDSLHALVQKNSVKIPSLYGRKPLTFQTFNIIWDENMINFKIMETTPYKKYYSLNNGFK